MVGKNLHPHEQALNFFRFFISLQKNLESYWMNLDNSVFTGKIPYTKLSFKQQTPGNAMYSGR